MAPMYYRKANAAFLVYDITQYSTFENMKTWAEGQWHMTMSSQFFKENCVEIGTECPDT